MKQFICSVMCFACMAGVLFAGGSADLQKTAEPTNQPVFNVYTAILPQKYFVERIGGNTVSVSAMVQEGFSPGTYEPKPEQMTALANSALFFSIGAPFEKVWLGKISAVNQNMKIVDTTIGVDRIPSGKGYDAHIWLGPEAVKQQAVLIRDALTELNPAGKDVYLENYRVFVNEITLLQKDLTKMFSRLKDRGFIVFHPAWGYFAREFNLEQIAVEKNGQEPNAGDLAALVDTVKSRGFKVVIVHPEFSTRTAELLAEEIGAETVVVSPLNPDWFSNQRRMADAILSSVPN